jgi:hypothetical protein
MKTFKRCDRIQYNSSGLSLFSTEIACSFTARQKDFILIETADKSLLSLSRALYWLLLKLLRLFTRENSKYDLRKANTEYVRELCTIIRQK